MRVKSRKMTKTQAEYQRKYRDRQKAKKLTESTNAPQPNAPSLTHVCRTCGGPVQHPKVVKCLKCCTGTPSPKVDLNKTIYPPHPTGPLSVYSPARWSFLQGRGYVWSPDRQRSVKAETGTPEGYMVGVTVPGDPAYEGIAC